MNRTNALTISVYSLKELDLALRNAIESHFQPTLAIIFSSPDFPFEQAIPIFSQYQIQTCGVTTSGEIFNQSIVHDSLTVLLLALDPSVFRVVQFQHRNIEAYESGVQLYRHAMQTFENPGIIVFISGVEVVGDGPVAGIRDQMVSEIPIYGGLAGDNLQHKATYTFTQEGPTDFGLSAVILDQDAVKMESLAVSGWKPLGRIHTITRAEQNVIFEIDQQPALDLFLNYFGNIEYKLADSKGLFSIPGQYPLQIQREDGSSFLRSLLIYDQENRALLAAGKMETGAKFRFCPPPDFQVVDQTVEAFRGFSQDHTEMDALLMVSCKGRHTSFGPLLEDEVRAIYDIWDAPMAGFLANGEIGSSVQNGICEFHNVTCSLLGIKIN